MFNTGNFIERSIAGTISFLKESIFADEYALKNGFLQSLDPRIKMATFLLFIVQVLFADTITIIFCLYALCILLAAVSGIGLRFFLKRTWVFIPIFSFFIAIPALFSFFSPGEAIASFNIFALKAVITRQGLHGAVLFIARVTTSLSFAVLLSVTTRNFELLKALRSFRIPQIFVMTLGMCYRYIYLFVEIIESTYLAIKSRVGRKVHYKKGQGRVAWNIASLWGRSYQLNEEVYRAMLSRGYRGEPLTLDEFEIRPKDWAWVICAVAIVIVCFLSPLGRGSR